MPDEIRVLHVDDDPSHLQVARLILEEADPHIHVQSAGDPSEALRRIAEAPVDCVVTDYMMPDLNGIQLAAAIRERSDAPIILYTGQGSEEVAEEAFAVGVDDYIRKEPDPGHYRVLARRIRAAVEKRRAEAELRASEENYRNVIERANLGVIVTQDGLLRFANRRVSEITGYPPEEAVGTPFIDYLHPDDRTEALEAYRNRDISEDTFFPFRVITREGETRWIEVNGVAIEWGGSPASLHFIYDITERRLAEERVRETESMILGLAEQSPSMIFINRGGRVLYANRICEEVMGYTREEFYAPDFDFMTLIAPESAALIRENYGRHLRGEEVPPYEYALLTRDGERLDAIISTKLVSYGGDTSILGIVTDISERKRMEKSLQDSEERYRSLFETSPFAISIHDIDGVITSVNPAFRDLTGFSEEELVGKTLSAIASQQNVGQEKVDFIVEMRRALLSEGELSSFEYPFKRKDGTERWCLVHASLLQMDGDRVGIQILAQDITEQKAIREALQRSEEDNRRLIDSAPDAITTADLRGYITSVNQRVIDSTGLSREELIGKHVGELGFILPEYRGMLRNLVGSVVRGKVPGPFKVRIRRGDGSETLGEVSLNLIKKDGKTVGVQTITRDVTERQRAEDERLRYQERLEALHRHTLALGEANSIPEVAEKTLTSIEKALGFDLGSFAVVDGGALRMVKSTGSQVEAGYTWPLDGPGVTVRAVNSGASQLVPDVRLDKDYHPGLSKGLYEVQSELAVPITSEGEVIGVINIESQALNAFTEQDKALLETLSQNVGLTVSRLKNLELLRASEERYRTFLDSSRDAIFVLDDAQYLYVNNSGARLLGYDHPEELIGTPPFKHISPKDREMVESMVIKRRRGEEAPNRYEFRLIRKDGEEIVIETSVSLVEYEGRLASLAVNRDITEQKRMEEELREANSSLGERVKEITCLYNSIQAMEEVDSIEELGPKIVEQLVKAMQFPEQATAVFELGGQVFTQGRLPDDQANGIHAKIVTKDVELGGLSVHYPEQLPFMDEESDMLNALAEGIGGWYERVEAVRTLQEHTTRLEAMVEEKTQELLDAERLVTAGRIAATVGHDLRGPLQTIKNAIYLIRQSPESADEMIEMVNKSVDRASEMIDVFRSQTRYAPLAMGEVDLVDMVRKSVEEMTLPRSIEAVMDLDEGLRRVYLDGTKIHRLIDNLIQNAVEAMPTGGTLTITAKREHGMLVLRVSDTGVGVPEDERAYLFKPFHTTKKGGLGLGLYYCKRTVEAHEGSIELDSEAGEGTRVTITIPLLTREHASQLAPSALRDKLKRPSPNL